MQTRLPISVAVITANEAGELAALFGIGARCRCGELALKIVVLDCGSTDGPNRRRKVRAGVLSIREGYVSQRTNALACVFATWALCMDVMSVSPRSAQSIRALFAEVTPRGRRYEVNRRTFISVAGFA